MNVSNDNNGDRRPFSGQIKAYMFENLSDLERLEILAFDPSFQRVCDWLPEYGVTTKPSMTSTTGMMLVGAFTVICGSDDRANAELRYHWLQVREIYIASGIGAPRGPLTVDHWHDFRDTFLAGRTRTNDKTRSRTKVDELGEIVRLIQALVRHEAIGQARGIGMLDACEWQSGADGLWTDIPMERTIMGDGIWFREQCSVNPPPRPSHSGKNGTSKDTRRVRVTRADYGRGQRRVSRQIDTRGNATGYENVIVSVRGPEPRRWIVFDVLTAPKGNEMDSFIESMRELREVIGDGEYVALYDGAMHGVHHTILREELGLLTVNKVAGFDGNRWTTLREAPAGDDVITEPMSFTASNGDTCTMDLWAAASVLWVVEEHFGRRCTVRTADHHKVTRTEIDGRYQWSLDMSIYCPHHDEEHFFTLDPNGKLGRSLAAQLRILPQSRAKQFGKIYGRRNAAESGMRHLRYLMGRTHRSGSMTADRTDLDVMLAVMLNNALAWAEHFPKNDYRTQHRYQAPRKRRTVG